MNLTAPIIELQFALKDIEERIKSYHPPICKYENEYIALNGIRNQYIAAIKILQKNESNITT